MELNLCPPAIIYLIFSVTQILIDTYKGFYNTALIKCIVTVMITFLLNILCQKELSIVSWIIVFLPFLFMTVIVTMILYIFGLNATTGSINTNCSSSNNLGQGIQYDVSGNIIIYDPEYNATTNPVYFSSPYIVVPNPNANNLLYPNTATSTQTQSVPYGTSSPAYQS